MSIEPDLLRLLKRRKLEEAKRQAAILGSAPQRRTLGYLLDAWLAAEQGRLSPRTLEDY